MLVMSPQQDKVWRNIQIFNFLLHLNKCSSFLVGWGITPPNMSEWAVLVCRLNKTKFGKIFKETLKQNSPDSEAPNTFRVKHRIWQTGGILHTSFCFVVFCQFAPKQQNKQIYIRNILSLQDS